VKFIVLRQACYLFTIFHNIVLPFKKLVFLVIYSHLPIFAGELCLLFVLCLLKPKDNVNIILPYFPWIVTILDLYSVVHHEEK
jgi:lipid-A-disaccharide synthase-like uncharacterized protein